MRWLILLSSIFLSACGTRDNTIFSNKESFMLSKTSIIKLDFTCKHETIPEPGPEVDQLFRYARWLQKNNQLKRDPSVNAEIERLYRVAAENGHYKANINLQIGATRGRHKLRGHEYLRFSQELIDAGVASGYYFMAIFLQKGVAGLKQDSEMALQFYRKAADEGNAGAQAYVADKLAPIDIAPEIARKMRRCAAEQGRGDSAVSLAITYKLKKEYGDALSAFQMGVAAGDESAAGFLISGFKAPPPENELYFLNLSADLERSERYKKIWRILANYSFADPKVPEINEIVPLPPAKLPPWDGKLKWLEERLANIPPPKPDEWLIEKLAKEKLLDPATGKPKPGSPAFRADLFPADTCESGTPCPQEGYWKVMWPENWVHNEEQVQHFNEGELMPHPEGNYYVFRTWPLPRKMVKGPMFVTWGLLG